MTRTTVPLTRGWAGAGHFTEVSLPPGRRHLANVSFILDKTWAFGGAEQAVPGFRERLGRAWGPFVLLRGNELTSTREGRCQVINCN